VLLCPQLDFCHFHSSHVGGNLNVAIIALGDLLDTYPQALKERELIHNNISKEAIKVLFGNDSSVLEVLLDVESKVDCSRFVLDGHDEDDGNSSAPS
jgi:hypothetical protein